MQCPQAISLCFPSESFPKDQCQRPTVSPPAACSRASFFPNNQKRGLRTGPPRAASTNSQLVGCLTYKLQCHQHGNGLAEMRFDRSLQGLWWWSVLRDRKEVEENVVRWGSDLERRGRKVSWNQIWKEPRARGQEREHHHTLDAAEARQRWRHVQERDSQYVGRRMQAGEPEEARGKFMDGERERTWCYMVNEKRMKKVGRDKGGGLALGPLRGQRVV